MPTFSIKNTVEKRGLWEGLDDHLLNNQHQYRKASAEFFEDEPQWAQYRMYRESVEMKGNQTMFNH